MNLKSEYLNLRYAFLVYTSQVLFFFPSGRLLPQLEATGEPKIA